jgi:hypothetical protein
MYPEHMYNSGAASVKHTKNVGIGRKPTEATYVGQTTRIKTLQKTGITYPALATGQPIPDLPDLLLSVSDNFSQVLISGITTGKE